MDFSLETEDWKCIPANWHKKHKSAKFCGNTQKSKEHEAATADTALIKEVSLPGWALNKGFRSLTCILVQVQW